MQINIIHNHKSLYSFFVSQSLNSSYLQMSFLENCLDCFQAKLEIADHVNNTPEHAVVPQQCKPSFKQLYHGYQLSKEFVARPLSVSETSIELSSYPDDQRVHFDNFRSCFHQFLDKKYSHLDERGLFGEDEKPLTGIVATDFADIHACKKLSDYQEFLNKLFGRYASVNELQTYFKRWYKFAIPDQLQQEIKNEVSSFFCYLLETRAQTIEIFQQYEQGFYKELCSFSKFKSIINSELSTKLNEIANNFTAKVKHLRCVILDSQGQPNTEANTEELTIRRVMKDLVDSHLLCSIDTTPRAQAMRECVCRLEIELYKEVLNVLPINQRDMEQVQQCLNYKSNHDSYLHQHLNNLCELLNIILSPYEVLHGSNDIQSIYTVTMVVGSVSGALSAFSEWLANSDGEHRLKEGDVLRLCANTMLYLDCDVRYDYLSFQGVNVVLISPNVSHEKDGKVLINTDGKVLESVCQTEDAASGEDGTKDKRDGHPGEDGEDGYYGYAGGHILIVGRNLQQLDFDLSAKGSRGQDGQNGGNGGNGWTPPKDLEGQDANKPQFKRGRKRTKDSVVIQYGTYGHSSGQGGDAGMGGAAGKSGISGKFEFIDLENATNCKTSQEPVEDGKFGEPGKPGKGGKHARHGRDWGRYASSLGFGGKVYTFVTTTRPGDSIKFIKGDLEHPAIPYEPGSGNQHEKQGAKGLPRQHKSEDHPDYIDRGSNKDGKPAQKKVNTAVAKENKAIDKFACFKVMNDLCRTMKHWNYKNHLKLLISFANRIGERYESELMTMTRSERIRKYQDKWVDEIENLSGKTAVTVVYTRQQTQKNSGQLMKEFEKSHASSTDSYLLSNEADIDFKPIHIDLSEFETRAKQRGILFCNKLSLESILTDDRFDDYIDDFSTNLGLAEIHIVTVDNAVKCKALACGYDFLIVNNRQEKSWFLCHTQGACTIAIDDESLTEALNNVDLKKHLNQPVSMESVIYLYPNTMKWICSKLGSEPSTILPCTKKQMECILKLNFLMSIKRSYKALSIMCKKKELHLFQSNYAKLIHQILHCKQPVLVHLRTLQERNNESKHFIKQFDLSWLEVNPESDELQELKDAVKVYNKDYTLERLLAVITTFVNYHTISCASAKEEYCSFLKRETTKIKGFTDQLNDYLVLFNEKEIAVPENKFENFKIQEILQTVVAQNDELSEFEEYTEVESSLLVVNKLLANLTTPTDVDLALTTLTANMKKLWHIEVSSGSSEATLLQSKETFKQRCIVFHSNPSLTELCKLMEAYTILKPALSHCKDDLEQLFRYTFDQIRMHLINFKQDSLQFGFEFSLEIEVECLQESIKNIPVLTSQTKALCFLLQQLQCLLSQPETIKQDPEVQLFEPTKLLVDISKLFEDMFAYYDQLMYLTKEKETERETALKRMLIDTENIRSLTASLLNYPMACPSLSVINWASFLEKKLIRTVSQKPRLYRRKAKSDNVPEDSTLFERKMVENLESLQSELNTCLEKISSLGKLLQNLDLVIFAKDLSSYAVLDVESSQQIGAKKIVQTHLGLHEPFIDEGFLEHFSQWLQPGLLGLSSIELRIQMKRLAPKQDLLVRSKEPRIFPKNTIILLATGNNTWKTCSKDTSTHTESYQYRDVSADVISNILGKDAHTKVTEAGEMVLSNEKKAEILGELNFEETVSVIREVQLCHQTIVSENSSAFLLVEIDLNAISIKILRDQPTGKILNFNEEKIFLVFCHRNSEVFAELEDEQSQSLQNAAFLCILKFPSQDVITKKVTNCGDCVAMNYCYSPPLATDHLHASSDTFIEYIRPVATLLTSYQDLYGNYVPNKQLWKEFKISIEQCARTLFKADVSYLVIKIRCSFIRSICGGINEDSSSILKVILNVKDDVLSGTYKNPFFKGLLLTGLELIICFVLLQTSKQKSSEEKPGRAHQQNTNIHHLYSYWLYIRNKKYLSKSEAKDLLTAFTYLKESERVNEGLLHESAAIKSQAYTSILNGLRLFDVEVHRDKLLASQTEMLKDEVSHFLKVSKVEIFWDCSCRPAEDTKNLPSLFALIHCNESLSEEVMQLASVCDISTDTSEEACHQLLQSPSFFVDIADTVFVWIIKQLHSLFQEFQVLITQILFLDVKEMATTINVFTSWVINEIEEGFTRKDWVNIQQHFVLAKNCVMGVYMQLHENPKAKQSRVHCPSVIQDLEKLCKIIKFSDNLAEVNSILESVPSEQWLKYLIRLNFLSISQNYYSQAIHEEFGDQLLLLDTKLLQIFFNVFVNDQYNMLTTNSQHTDLAGYVSLDQIRKILSWLSLIEPGHSACTILCRTSLALWEKELAEIYFKQYLDHWTDISEADKQKTVYLMNRVRLDTEVNNDDFIALLCTVRRKYLGSCGDAKVFLGLFEDMYYGRVSHYQVQIVVFKYEYTNWSEKLEEFKNMKREAGEPQNVSEVLASIKAQIRSGGYNISHQHFEVIKHEAERVISWVEQNKCNTSFLNFFCTLRRNRSIEEKMEWLKEEDRLVKLVASIVIAWIFFTNQEEIPYNTQIVSLLLFLHANDSGLLQQVKTGEGKTLVVAMLAAAKALLGYHVDIVTSNRDLAQMGMTKCQPFFKQLGLQAAVNCTEDDDTNQQAYKSHIVYGDVGSFQRDVLTEESKPGGTSFSARYSDLSRNCLLVDEVDNMFLDKAQHMLYLSHETATLKHLEYLLIMIWSAVLSVNEKNELPVDKVTTQLAHKLAILIDNGMIVIPEYLKDFCKKKLKCWVQSAYEARLMDVDDQFVIGSKTQHCAVSQIYPIDKQTGIEQYNMKWADGLSIFLELKFQRPLSTESLRAIFISNKRFFMRYGKQLFGLTGTLGSQSSRSLLQKVYNIKTVEIPTNKPKLYVQTKSQLATNSESWCELINEEISSVIREQPVLVIFENIKQLNLVRQHLEKDSTIKIVKDNKDLDCHFPAKLQVIHYARDGDDVEDRFHKQGARPGQLILATNKGGRGTDIKVDIEEAPKGLHVILSYLPENTRIEEQAFGRAARAGQAGSGCLIIQIDPVRYSETLQMFNENMKKAAETLVEKEKIKRNRAETERLTLLLNEGIPKLGLEEDLYSAFQKHRKLLTTVLENGILFEVRIKGTKHIMRACQSIVTNRWAFWLESVRAQIRSANTPDKRQAIKDMFHEEFPCEGLLVPSSDRDSTFFRLPEDYIKLGQAYMKEVRYQKTKGKKNIETLYMAALKCFERANDNGDMTGFAAMAACCCFIKVNPEANKDNKKKVRHYLKIARSILTTLKQGWMGNVEVSKALAGLVDVSQYSIIIGKNENHYAQQIEGKLKVIGLHLHIIETLLGNSVEESSFVNESSQMISLEKSKEIYQILCSEGIICHNKVRKSWKIQEKIENLFKRDLEVTIVPHFVELILKKETISEDDLTHLVYSSDELWDILAPLVCTTEIVVILKVKQIDDKLLDQELAHSWQSIRHEFCNGSTECTQCVLVPGDKRLGFAKRYSKLTTFLANNGLCIHSLRGKLKDDAIRQVEIINLGKFKQCTVEEQTLREYLGELLDYCVKSESGYLYEYMLPFGKKSQQTKKLYTFLQEQNILKSGELAVHKYDDNGSKFELLVRQAIGTNCSDIQINYILRVLQGLKGEIRKFEDLMRIELVRFEDLKDHPEDTPEELAFFTTWHMDQFLSIEQKSRGWWDWNAFAYAMMGVAQVAAGLAMLVLTAGPVEKVAGNSLITQGINDMVYATISSLTGRFSWKDYSIHKVVCIVLTVASGGINILAARASALTKFNSATHFSSFVKGAAQAAGVLAKNASATIQSDALLADIQERVVRSIIACISTGIFSLVEGKIKSKLMQLARETPNNNEFSKRCRDLVASLANKFDGNGSQSSRIFAVLQSQAVSALKEYCRRVAKDSALMTKLMTAGSKGMSLAEQIFTAAQNATGIATAAHNLGSLIDTEQTSSKSQQRSDDQIDMHIVEKEVQYMEECFKELVYKQLKEKVSLGLNNAIRKSFQLLARASSRLVRTSVEQAFNGKTSSELMKDIKEKTVMKERDKTQRDNSTAEPHEDESTEIPIKKRDDFQETIIEPKKQLAPVTHEKGNGAPVEAPTALQTQDSSEKRPTKPKVQITSVECISEERKHFVREFSQRLGNVPVPGYYTRAGKDTDAIYKQLYKHTSTSGTVV